MQVAAAARQRQQRARSLACDGLAGVDQLACARDARVARQNSLARRAADRVQPTRLGIERRRDIGGVIGNENFRPYLEERVNAWPTVGQNRYSASRGLENTPRW